MNTKSTDLARDKKYDYPDGKDNLFKDFALAMVIGFIVAVMTLTAVCHADKIDLFFQEVYKWMAL